MDWFAAGKTAFLCDFTENPVVANAPVIKAAGDPGKEDLPSSKAGFP